MNKKSSFLNNLNKTIIKIGFVEIFFNCFFLNSNIVLFKNIKCKNSQYLSFFLTHGEKNLNENWIFHYFVPLYNFNNNYLLVCFKKNLNINLMSLIESEVVYTDINQIIDIWCNNINWESENLNNHSFNWTDQAIVGEYLDSICEVSVSFLPVHWGKLENLTNLKDKWFDKTLWYYNVYLSNYNLDDTIENKIYFISKFKYDSLY